METDTEGGTGAPDQAKPSVLMRCRNPLLFLLCLGLPWLVVWIQPRMACAMYWPGTLVSQTTAHGLKSIASATYVTQFWVLGALLPVILWGLWAVFRSHAYRRTGLLVTAVVASTVLAFSVGLPYGFAYQISERARAFEVVIQRGQPIIDALNAYQKDKGDYPDSLQAIVPGYLKEMPNTGLVGYPDFQFKRTSSEARYELFVRLKSSDSEGKEFPRFYYWPSNRDKYDVDRIGYLLGDWAYSEL